MNILTFDIEEWYMYKLFSKGPENYYHPIIEDYLDRLLDFLEATNNHATFFCLGVMAREFPEILKKIHNLGYEIGCHSDKHTLITKMNPETFAFDTSLAINSIE